MARDGQAWVSRALGADASGSAGKASAAPTGGATFIDQGAVFEGCLRASGTLRVDGEFKGEIFGEAVIVGESAGIEARIVARSVMVSGAIAGRVVASREVVLRPTARLHADVESPSFVVERGAVLNGQTTMVRPEQRARAEAESPAPAKRDGTPAAPGSFASR